MSTPELSSGQSGKPQGTDNQSEQILSRRELLGGAVGIVYQF